MKRLFVILFAVSFCISVFAQSSPFDKGYRGNLSLGGNIGITKGIVYNSAGITTSHGYSFGDGVYLGAGLGCNMLFAGGVTLPVFIDAKYNIVDWTLSPFVDCRLGGEMIFTDNGDGGALVVNPGFGVDFNRFTFRVGYLCEAGSQTLSYNWGGYEVEAAKVHSKLHSMTVSFAINF